MFIAYLGGLISGIPISISYSLNRGTSWNELTSVDSKNDGSYTALWFPTVTGNYMIRAVSTADSIDNERTPGLLPGTVVAFMSIFCAWTVTEIHVNAIAVMNDEYPGI